MEIWKAEAKQKPEILVARGGDFLDLLMSSSFAVMVADCGGLTSISVSTSFPTWSNASHRSHWG